MLDIKHMNELQVLKKGDEEDNNGSTAIISVSYM